MILCVSLMVHSWSWTIRSWSGKSDGGQWILDQQSTLFSHSQLALNMLKVRQLDYCKKKTVGSTYTAFGMRCTLASISPWTRFFHLKLKENGGSTCILPTTFWYTPISSISWLVYMHVSGGWLDVEFSGRMRAHRSTSIWEYVPAPPALKIDKLNGALWFVRFSIDLHMIRSRRATRCVVQCVLLWKKRRRSRYSY
jgi:hypothetical protein